ncbi:g1146 [Coccomyxa elongata]
MVFAVLTKVEENIRSSNWSDWLSRAGDEQKDALFMRSFAHTITAHPVARIDEIPGTGCNKAPGITWGDAENDGFVSLTDGLQAGQRHGQVLLRRRRSDSSDKDMDEQAEVVQDTGMLSSAAAADVGCLDGSEQAEVVQDAGMLSSAAADVGELDMNEGDAAPDDKKTTYVHIPPLLLRVMYQQLTIFCTWK